jgi:hypothetical protein
VNASAAVASLMIDDATRVASAAGGRAAAAEGVDLRGRGPAHAGAAEARPQVPGTRIHIFQSATDRLHRFRQYLASGETPALIVGSMIEDPFEAHLSLGWRRFAGRVLGLSARVRVVVVARTGERVAAPGIGVVCRPDARIATERDYQSFSGVGRALAVLA